MRTVLTSIGAIAPVLALALASALACVAPVSAAHPVLLQGNGRLVVLDEAGTVLWERPWGAIHDCHELPNGNFLVLEGRAKVSEIDRQSKQVVWSYDAATANGNEGRDIEVHACQPLAGGRVMIAETTSQRIIEVDRDGRILKQVDLKVEHPHPHTDTRLARKIANGNYLVCHEGDGAVREYDGQSGEVVWEYEVPMFGKPAAGGHGPEAFGNKAFSALRLPSGNTLISTGNGHSVLEVTPQKEIVWKLDQNDLPGITLAWVTTLEVLPGGNYVIGNCHAGPENPQLIEIEPATKRVVWTLDRYDDFGNDVSNTQVLGLKSPALR